MRATRWKTGRSSSASHMNDIVFLGYIKKVTWVGQDVRAKQKFYEVQCIPRPNGREGNTIVNDMNIVSIFSKSILCEMIQVDI